MKRGNIKYIVLGIGFGFIIAAILFLKFGGKEKEALSEREIIDRARALGMIFLTELPAEPEKSESSTAAPVKEAPVEKGMTEAEAEGKEAAESEPAEASAKTEESADQVEGQTVAADAADSKTEASQPVTEAPAQTPASSTKTQSDSAASVKKAATPAVDSDIVTEVISGDDPAAKELLPPKDPNRPKSTQTLPTNHF